MQKLDQKVGHGDKLLMFLVLDILKNYRRNLVKIVH